jgi:sugar (glycoside-pentoside-hexuronide) transporter
MDHEEKLPLREKLAFGFAGLGQNIIYNFVATYLMIFYTDVLGLLPVTVGVLMLVAKIWDAVNDPIMGSIVDRSHFKRGKLRSWLFWIPIPMIISTILLFVAPSFDYGAKVIYAYFTFILWDMVFTVSDVPFWGLSAAMTRNPKERLSLVTFARILCNVGMAISIVLPPLMFALFPDQKSGYFWTAVILITIGGLLFYLASLGTKERVADTEEPISFFKNLGLLLKNKPLLALQSSRMLGAFRMVIGIAGTYFAKYNMGDAKYFSLLGGILIASMIAAMFITPFFTKRFSKKTMYNASLLLGAFSHLAMFFAGYHNLPLVFFLLFLCGMSLGMNDVITYTMVGDTVDYLQWKTNRRTEGLTFSLHTFTTKFQSAFGSLWIGIVLTYVGFVENVPQSAQSLTGIFSLISVFPAIAAVMSIIPMFWYDLTEKKHEAILVEIESR